MKRISIVLVMALAVVLIASAGGTKAPAASAAAPYIMRIFMPGDSNAACEEVYTALNEKSIKDIGIGYSTEWVSWGDFDTKRALYLQSKESIDGMLVFQPELPAMWRQKAFTALNEYVSPQKTPSLLKAVPLKVFEDMAIDGEYTNFPSVAEYFNFYYGFIIRQDLREKWGMPAIQTKEQLWEYFEKCKQAGMIAIRWGHSHFNGLFRLMRKYAWFVGPDAITSGFAQLDEKTNKVSLWIDSPIFKEGAAIMRDLYVRGYQDPDVAAPGISDTDLFVQGKLGCYPHQIVNYFFMNQSSLKDSAIKAENAPLYADFTPRRNFWANNLVTVPRTSQQPGALAKWLDWIYGDRVGRWATIAYGIQGKDFLLEGTTVKPGPRTADQQFPVHWWFWQASYQFDDASWDPTVKEYYRQVRDPNAKVIEDPALGFVMDLTPVETIMTQLTEAWANIGMPIMQGLVDPNDGQRGIPALKKAYQAAGVDKFLAEAQRQWDAYIKAK